jgi:hypothetical protein
MGIAFAEAGLPEGLRRQIVLSPITILEVLTHLTLSNGDSILQQIRAIRNWVHPEGTKMLPWTNAALAVAMGLPLPPDTHFEALANASQICLNATEVTQVRNSAALLKDGLDELKDKVAIQFTLLVDSYRRTPMADSDFEVVFAAGIRQRVSETPVLPICELLKSLGAYYEFERDKLRIAAGNVNYRPERHANDLLDAEQLVYLADSRLCFLTCDGGYRKRVTRGPQRDRIHVRRIADFATPESISFMLREIVS